MATMMFRLAMTALLCILLFSEIAKSQGSDITRLNMAFFGHTSGHIGDFFFVTKLGSAVDVALDKIKNDNNLLNGVNISTYFADTFCSPKVGLDLIVNLTQKQDVHVVIAPACPSTSEVVGLFTSVRNIPTIGYSYSTDRLANIEVYDTMVTTKARDNADAVPLSGVLTQLNWTLTCVYTPSPFSLHHWKSVYGRLKGLLSEKNITLLKEIVFLWRRSPREAEHEETLEQIKETCRGKTLV